MKTSQRQFVSISILFILIISQFAYPQPASAATIRYAVVSGGLSTGPCDSWGAACTLQRALTAAVSGDEVWVQQGTYKPTTGADRNATFTIPNGVAIYGGFIGTETARSQRNPDPANTILSGDIGTVGVRTDNSFHIVTIDNAGTSTLLDGFTVTLGHVTDADGNAFGAGIYITNSSPTLNNLIITDNQAGNTVGSGGGGVYINDLDLGSPVITPVISNVTFSNNRSGRGGGLFSHNSDPILENVVFIGNTALATGGGGMNSQTNGAFDPPINPILTNVSFINNTATGGGGLFIGNSTGHLTNVTFSGNVANRRGGGLLLEFSTAVLTNVTFYNNTSNNGGLDPRGGGGLMNVASSPTLNNVTFSGNTSTAASVDGSAMRNAQEPVTLQVSNPVIHNSIFWGDAATEITSDGTGSITVNDSIVQGGCPAGATCTNVLNSDPVLGALGNNGGFTQTMALGTGSAAIDAGNNSTCAAADQRGVTRPQGAACDMGAFEVEVASPSFTDTTVLDFNAGTVGDCVVDNTIGDGAVRLNIPSSTSCVFVSRIFDAGEPVDWVNLTWNGTTPAGTTVAFDARTGNTSTPDISWTSWQAANGTLTNPGSRYIQYRAALSTTDTGQTPAIEDVTIAYTAGSISVLNSPDGTVSNWNKNFSWTGVNGATHYLLEVYTPSMTQLLRKWYTSAQTNCPSGTACSLMPSASDLNLGNGDYQWRVMDYGAYGYGLWTLFKNFTLNAACYTLTLNVTPAGSGSVNVPPQSCTGGYTAGSVIQLTAVPGTGYAFSSWSGDVGGTTNPISITMDANKTVTVHMRGNTPLSPAGTLNDWNYEFSWTGPSDATHYLLEVQTSGGMQVFRKWYMSSQTGCSGETACSVTPTDLSLANGDYKWRVMDYGAYGYGTNSTFKNFTLNITTCHVLTTNVRPGSSGSITVPAQTCMGGYTAGSVIQLTAVPGTGYLFNNWSGDAGGTTNPVFITMNGNKTVTANFKATTILIAPNGTITSWNNTFSWTGLTNATHYLLEVYMVDGSVMVFRKWYMSPQTGCSGSTACSISPPETAGLANGDYKWRILDYGPYGYGTWTSYMSFALSQ